MGTADGQRGPVRFGANYTPRHGWFHAWENLDLGRTREDLAHLRSLGLDHVRIFPLWPLLQPNRGHIATHMIDRVIAVVEAAGDAGLAVSVDLLNGHLSSFDFLPAWVSTWHRRGIFTDPDVVAAQHELARTLGAQLALHKHVTGVTLGNEIGQFAASRHPDTHRTSPAEAHEWTSGLLSMLEEVFPAGAHHHCLDDDVWFTDDQPFSPADAVLLGASTTIHSWVFGGAGQRYGVDHPALPLFTRYLFEIASMWHDLCDAPADRRIWLQEIGAPTPWVTPEAAPQFAVDSIRSVLDHPRLEAVTWWCSHDVSRELLDFPEVEYTLGLIDSDGRTKPIGEAISALIREQRDAESATTAPPTDAEAAGHAAAPSPILVPDLVLDGSNRSLTATDSAVFGEWIDSALNGQIRPLRAMSPELVGTPSAPDDLCATP